MVAASGDDAGGATRVRLAAMCDGGNEGGLHSRARRKPRGLTLPHSAIPSSARAKTKSQWRRMLRLQAFTPVQLARSITWRKATCDKGARDGSLDERNGHGLGMFSSRLGSG